jgi:hypothetical protein
MGDLPEKLLWFRSDGAPLARSGDALLCLALPPAMEVSAPLLLHDAISPRMSSALPRLRRLLCDWYPGLAAIPIETTLAELRETSTPQQTALFFSAGVDSSFSLAADRERIDCLITVIGADVPVADVERADRLRRKAREVATAYQKECICIETNVREVMNRWVGWVEYHGAVLAAIAHMLSRQVKHALIASSADASSWLRPWGTHPGLDPLWGNDILSIEHHLLVPRLKKIMRILSEPALMSRLRVCDYDDHNCGQCPDCQWMLTSLNVLDAFDLAPTYRKADVKHQRIRVDGFGTHSDAIDLQAEAQQRGKSNIVAQIDISLRLFHLQKTIEKICPLPEIRQKFRRMKRRMRYRRATTTSG